MEGQRVDVFEPPQPEAGAPPALHGGFGHPLFAARRVGGPACRAPAWSGMRGGLVVTDDGADLEAFAEPVVRVYTGQAVTLRAARVPAPAMCR
jgi:hypothetical protein